jgi:hypothetical protein
MIALVCFVLAALASPFKWKSRLEAENAALRHQLIVLRRRVRGRHERNRQTGLQTGLTVPLLSQRKCLKNLVGAPELEAGIR